MTKCALVMAGGTGGHIFPGLAVAHALRDRGWRVHWLGAPDSMESRLVPPQGFALETVDFSGVRGKGLVTLALLPLRLLRAFWQSLQVVRRVKPDVVLGLGGYITFPGGMMGVLLGKPLVLHEQNSVAGMANKVLSGVADRVFTAFPKVLRNASWVGNPLREAFLSQPGPAERFAGRQGPLQAAGGGWQPGRQGAERRGAAALALIPAPQRPQVLHQSGARQIDELRANYAAAGVQAELAPFIDDTGQRLRGCRPGDLPRRRQHSDRNCSGGRGGAVRAVPVRGGRPPDHQREIPDRCRRRAGWFSKATSHPRGWPTCYKKQSDPRCWSAACRPKPCKRQAPPKRWLPPARS
jgi:UDP-N-acetylglucosamine--N-acetylmuramyl-(pentapeptide) pyrophosphoryl-undecaprenol N-acetylglucosamine transferase